LADKKITDLTALGAAPAATDIIPLVDDPSGTPQTKSMTVTNLFTSPTLVTPALGTPASGVATNLTGVSGITGLGVQAQNLDMDGNDVVDFDVLTQTSQTDAQTVGKIRLANNQSLTWDNNAGDGQFRLSVDTADDLSFENAAGTEVWDISSASMKLTGITLNMNNNDILTGTGGGCKIATATTQKVGFWDTTPIVQPLHIADPTDLATSITAIEAINAMLAATGLTAAS